MADQHQQHAALQYGYALMHIGSPVSNCEHVILERGEMLSFKLDVDLVLQVHHDRFLRLLIDFLIHGVEVLAAIVEFTRLCQSAGGALLHFFCPLHGFIAALVADNYTSGAFFQMLSHEMHI